jgi:hypothetical protein
MDPPPFKLDPQNREQPEEPELDEEREIRKIWILEEIEGWDFRPTSDPKDPPNIRRKRGISRKFS